MPSIDIPVKPDLQAALNLEPCEALRLPSPTPLKIQLPTGGHLQAFNDISKGIPNDCSMTFNLMLQVAPLLASMDCMLKMLKLLDKVVSLVTNPPPTPGAIKDVVDAAAEIAPCFLIPTPLGILPFVCDILNLIRSVLHCLLAQLTSVRDLMQGLTLRLEAATGNDDLLKTLQCAQENAQASANNLSQAIEPVTVLLGLVSPLLKLAQLPDLQLSTPGGPPESVEALSALITTLQGVVDVIDEITGVACGAV
ncbi:hypothetical protein [Solirubrobacter soli]|uniref:hypothetical protein n=1 Tax=Solirubrobacter soli TaxID=363832 RepID=UPI0004242D79|nr:hypothetical protein [Solirubrobacter soli]